MTDTEPTPHKLPVGDDSDMRVTAILDALPANIALLNADGEILSVNASWRQFAIANEGRFPIANAGVGMNYLDVCDKTSGPDAIEAGNAAAGIRSVLTGTTTGFTFEYACDSPSVRRWFQMTVTPLSTLTPRSVVVMHLDISERRRAHQSMLESELQFRQIAENITDVFILREAVGGRVLYVSPAYEQVWGRSRASLYAHPLSCADPVHPDDRDMVLAQTGDANPTGDFHIEFRLAHPDGSIRWIRSRGFPVRDAAGDLVRIAIIARDVTERKQAEIGQRESERRFSDLLDNIELLALMIDRDANITFCNDYMLRIIGWRREEVIGRNVIELLIPPPHSEISQVFARLLENDPHYLHDEREIRTRSGELRMIRWNNTVLRSLDGEVIGTASIGEDITAQRLAEVSVRSLTRVYSMLSDINALIVRVHDRDELFARACEIAVKYGGFRMSMIATCGSDLNSIVPVAWGGKSEQLVASIRAMVSVPEKMHKTMIATAIREKTVLVANDSLTDPRLTLGPAYAAAGVGSLAVFPLVIGDRAIGAFVLYASEADFFHEAELKLLTQLAGDIAFAADHIDKSQRLDFLAFYDALTGLPNARLFKDRVSQFIQSARPEHANVCVVVFDLERFTQLNDSLGRHVGDELLRAVANRLVEYLVEPYAALGRIGADTFAVASPSEAEGVPTRLRDCVFAALEQPFVVFGHTLKVIAQAGVALYPADGDNAQAVFNNAEAALRMAKGAGLRVTYFSHELNARSAQRFDLEQQLRGAIAAEQFVMHYQARVDLISGEVVGAEALIRWQHPERGLITPSEFIPLAEETGLIVAIGTWVLDVVCAQQAAWVAAGLTAVPVAVNLSSVQFDKGDLVDLVRSALIRHGLAANLLILELTESSVMNDPTGAAATLLTLRKLGVGLALDDFGTGYSSLAHLKRFPFDSVKIDQSFIADLTHNAEDAAIAKAIIAMAHALSLRVVAEGVETQGQFNYLKTLACDEMQGHFFSAAVTAEKFTEQLRTRTRLMLPAPTPENQRTLLIVDDEQGIRTALMRMLRRDGYRILDAASGEEGLEILAIHRVDVIISDQRMPGMTGTVFLSKVAAMYPDTVRMILSGYTELNVVTEAVNRGSVFKFLTKPWDDERLRDDVRDAFRRHRDMAGRV